VDEPKLSSCLTYVIAISLALVLWGALAWIAGVCFALGLRMGLGQ
jgi:hypothetical protein